MRSKTYQTIFFR